MNVKQFRSRILEYFPSKIYNDLLRVCLERTIPDNNTKVDLMIKILNASGIEYTELGPGTNRLAILIENYVFKIALDRLGLQDNNNEFAFSRDLQPYVAKTYEVSADGLMCVSEYVTVITREEFIEKREDIRDILAELAESYLLGDVGTVPKNFCNWGYRDDGQLVILDFAYIYQVRGDELLCTKDQAILEYDENFYELVCPRCKKKYRFIDIQNRITKSEEKKISDMAKEYAYHLSSPVQTLQIQDEYIEEEIDARSLRLRDPSLYKTKTEEESSMSRDRFEDKMYDGRGGDEEDYQAALDELRAFRNGDRPAEPTHELKVMDAHSAYPESLETIEISRTSATESTHVHVVRRVEENPNDPVNEAIQAIQQEVSEGATDNGIKQFESNHESTRISDGVLIHEEEVISKSQEGVVESDKTVTVTDGENEMVDHETTRTAPPMYMIGRDENTDALDQDEDDTNDNESNEPENPNQGELVINEDRVDELSNQYAQLDHESDSTVEVFRREEGITVNVTAHIPANGEGPIDVEVEVEKDEFDRAIEESIRNGEFQNPDRDVW